MLSTAIVFCLSAALPVSAYAVQLIPVGSAVGIEVDVDGVLVDEVSEVVTEGGREMPAKKAGVKVGDVVTAVNGT
ncbi:MAG: SpoIVB peptidase, partial [Oscillospiraceae bacterium]|nr:SpoIVB peptidase [Oscillospiraceae bacterium]